MEGEKWREREGARFGGSRIRARPLPPPHTRTYVHVARTCKYIAVEWSAVGFAR